LSAIRNTLSHKSEKKLLILSDVKWARFFGLKFPFGHGMEAGLLRPSWPTIFWQFSGTDQNAWIIERIKASAQNIIIDMLSLNTLAYVVNNKVGNLEWLD
jgi:hypothetical protein